MNQQQIDHVTAKQAAECEKSIVIELHRIESLRTQRTLLQEFKNLRTATKAKTNEFQDLATQEMKDNWTINSTESRSRVYGNLMQLTSSSSRSHLSSLNCTLAREHGARRSNR